MDNSTNETFRNEIKIAPALDNALKFFQKYRHWEPAGHGQLGILMHEVLQASRLSQLYFEGYLSQKYHERIKILRTSIVHSTDVELRELIRTIPELNDYDLATGDPGFYYLMQRAKPYPDNFNEGASEALLMNSIEEPYEFFEVFTLYSFFNRRKKNLQQEFELAADKMADLQLRHNLPGRHKRNAFSNPENKTKKKTPNLTFLQNYRPR
jgi:hypothetical protein